MSVVKDRHRLLHGIILTRLVSSRGKRTTRGIGSVSVRVAVVRVWLVVKALRTRWDNVHTGCDQMSNLYSLSTILSMDGHKGALSYRTRIFPITRDKWGHSRHIMHAVDVTARCTGPTGYNIVA